MLPSPPSTHPPQRSFKPRRRGLSPARQAAYQAALVRWSIGVSGPPLSFKHVFGDTLFGDDSDVVLDIGFGTGEALIDLAEVRPYEHVIGVEVHTPGIAAVLAEVERRGLTNVRVVEGDVLDLLGRVPQRSLAAIRVFFPDPWPKRRQGGRRLIRPEVVHGLSSRLRVGGSLHLATDAAEYAEQMRRVCDAASTLTGGPVTRPSWRPQTRFELRGLVDGRPAVDLLYIASDSSPSESSSASR